MSTPAWLHRFGSSSRHSAFESSFVEPAINANVAPTPTPTTPTPASTYTNGLGAPPVVPLSCAKSDGFGAAEPAAGSERGSLTAPNDCGGAVEPVPAFGASS